VHAEIGRGKPIEEDKVEAQEKKIEDAGGGESGCEANELLLARVRCSHISKGKRVSGRV